MREEYTIFQTAPKESAAALGRKLGSLKRSSDAGVRVANDDVWEVFAALMDGEVQTPADIMALMVSALAIIDALEDSTPDEFAKECAVSLVQKSIAALEQISGVDAGTFDGSAPLKN